MLKHSRQMPSEREGSGSTLLYDTRQRLLTLTSLITFVFASIWIALTSGTVIEGRPFIAFLCVLTPLVFLPIPFLAHRALVRLDVLCHAYLILYFAVVATVAGAFGGMVSTTSFFLMLAPMLATLLLGVRTGLAWLGIVMATFAAFHGWRELLPASTYDSIGERPSEWIRAQEISFWNGCMMMFLAVATCLSVGNFRVLLQRSSALLVKSAIEARDAREGLVAAEEISRSKSEFIATVGHEFRTPLNAIVGYSELLIEAAEDEGRSEDARDNKQVLEAARRLLAMVNEMMRLSAIEAGRQKLSVDECDVNALVCDAVVAATPAARANGNRIEVAPFDQPGLWWCDGPKLDHCLRHLLSNAAKFTKEGVITVRATRETSDGKSWLRIDVADTGVGIVPEQLDTIFRPFAVSGASQARQNDGVGIGLAVTRQLLRLMGGDVSVESEPGRGSCFTMRAPADFMPGAVANAA